MDYEKAFGRAKSAYGTGAYDDLTLEFIFPELRESEDERMHKLNLWFLRKYKEISHYPGNSEKGVDMVISYLEKQKEQPKEELVYRLNGLMQDYIKEGKDDEEKEHRFKCYQLFWDALENTSYFEQEEQKPVERSLEDDHIIGFVYDLLNEIEWKDNWAMSKEECLRLLSNYRPQKPTEWSEEDEEMLNNIEYILHKDISYTPPAKPNSCTGSGNAYYTHQTEIDWLKSLRSPKSSDNWKPSEEQMKALQNAIALTACDKELVRLYNELKKL